MNRRERMTAAIRRQPVDRPPFATYNLNPFSDRHGQAPSYALLLQVVREKAGVYAKTGASPIKTAADEETEQRTETARRTDGDKTITTLILHTPKGDLRSVRVKPKDQPGMRIEHYVKTDADIERYMSLPFEPHDFDVTAPREMAESLREIGITLTPYGDPMYQAASLFDFNNFAMRCVTDLASMVRFIDFFFERVEEETRRLVKACQGLDVGFLTMGPEVCTPPMISPALFPTLVTPYHERLIEIIHEGGFFTGIHCHGRVRDVFPEMIRTGADFLEPIEPPDQGDISIEELMEQADGRICLIGHIQDQELHHSPPGAMTKRVEDIARAVAGRTGYIMTPTCTPFQFPATDTYIRNYCEWLDAADRLL